VVHHRWLTGSVVIGSLVLRVPCNVGSLLPPYICSLSCLFHSCFFAHAVFSLSFYFQLLTPVLFLFFLFTLLCKDFWSPCSFQIPLVVYNSYSICDLSPPPFCYYLRHFWFVFYHWNLLRDKDPIIIILVFTTIPKPYCVVASRSSVTTEQIVKPRRPPCLNGNSQNTSICNITY
jgi:hypothetical protein